MISLSPDSGDSFEQFGWMDDHSRLSATSCFQLSSPKLPCRVLPLRTQAQRAYLHQTPRNSCAEQAYRRVKLNTLPDRPDLITAMKNKIRPGVTQAVRSDAVRIAGGSAIPGRISRGEHPPIFNQVDIPEIFYGKARFHIDVLRSRQRQDR
jgi:hypothetical protein